MKQKIIIFLLLITALSILFFYPKSSKVDNTYICTIYNKNNVPLADTKIILEGVLNKNILFKNYFEGNIKIYNETYLIKSIYSNKYDLSINDNKQSNYFKLSSFHTDSQTGETSYIATIIIDKNFNNIVKGESENVEKKYGKDSYFKSKNFKLE